MRIASWPSRDILFCLVLAWASTSSASLIFDTNLVVNGDAESGPGSLDGSVVASIPGWSTTGTFTVVKYNAPGGFPLPTDPGPTTRGTNFFAGGPTAPVSTASQLIDVSPAAAEIDQAAVFCTSAGWFGGYYFQDDNARLVATFKDPVNNVLGSFTNGIVKASDRTNTTSLVYREQSVTVPVGTRYILVTLIMTALNGPYNDGYADNLSLTLSQTPTMSATTTSTNAVLAWPATDSGWLVESAINVAGPWTNVAATPTLAAGQAIVTIPRGASPQFFRLRKP